MAGKHLVLIGAGGVGFFGRRGHRTVRTQAVFELERVGLVDAAAEGDDGVFHGGLGVREAPVHPLPLAVPLGVKYAALSHSAVAVFFPLNPEAEL